MMALISSTPACIAACMFLLFAYAQLVRKPVLLVREEAGYGLPTEKLTRGQKAARTAQKTFAFMFVAFCFRALRYCLERIIAPGNQVFDILGSTIGYVGVFCIFMTALSYIRATNFQVFG